MRNILFLLILILFSLFGLTFPEIFKGFKAYIVPLLVVIMLSMGLTLTPEDFLNIFKRPYIIFYGAFLQYTVMPISAYLIGNFLNLPPEIFVGVVLVGSAPGGTASNLITYLSKGDLPYSISMTTLSTLLSPIFTPLWVYILAGKYVQVPFLAIFETTLKIVVLPVLSGMILRYFLRYKIGKIETLLPYLAIFSISLIIATIFAVNIEVIKEVSGILLTAVLIHNISGFLFGFLFGIIAGLDFKRAKTLSIEVGMQNSGFSAVLAVKFFTKTTALPSAVFSLSQNLIGVILSFFFRKI